METVTMGRMKRPGKGVQKDHGVERGLTPQGEEQ